MYDRRTPFQIVKKALSFKFVPNRYEIWAGGKLIDKNYLYDGMMQCIPSIFSESQSEVKFFNFPQKLNIRHTLLFDMTYTSGDRIYLATVPKETNININPAFLSFKNNVPLGFPIITREKRDFDENEPYVCSIFTIDNIIKKVSFSFANNPRLLELYND